MFNLEQVVRVKPTLLGEYSTYVEINSLLNQSLNKIEGNSMYCISAASNRPRRPQPILPPPILFLTFLITFVNRKINKNDKVKVTIKGVYFTLQAQI